jgi:hypothetical protein
MNERIRELLIKSQVNSYSSTDWYTMTPEMIQAFAELIVRECLDEIQYDDGATHVDELLPKHFGFEL